jgi:hypothetical protein
MTRHSTQFDCQCVAGRACLGTFTYLDAVVVDTPILDKDLRDYVPDAHTLAQRVERAFVFREYLDPSWKLIADADLPLDWPEKSKQALALLTRLSRREGPGAANYGPLFTSGGDGD